MVHIGKTLLVTIAVVAGHLGQLQDNTSWAMDTGNGTGSMPRDVFSASGLADSAPPGESAAVPVWTTVLPPKTKQLTGINLTNLAKLQMNWTPEIGIKNDTYGSGGSFESTLVNKSLAARNLLVDRRIQWRSQIILKHNDKVKSNEQTGNVLFGNASAYSSRIFKRAARDNNLTRQNGDQTPLLRGKSVGGAATRLTRDGNDSLTVLLSYSGIVNNGTSYSAFISVSGVVSNDTSAPVVMSMSGVVNNDTSAPAGMSVSESVINQTQKQESTLDNTNRLNGEAMVADDVPIFNVKLGDLSFTMCSEVTMCRHRCAAISGSAMELQDAVRKKREMAISDKEIHEFESMSPDLSGNDKLEGIYLQRRQQTIFAKQIETYIQEESEKTSLRTETMQTFQQRLNPRKQRSIDGYMPDARCANNSQNYTCFCDDSCVFYGDCCVDVFQSCFSTTNTEDIMNIIYDIKEIVNFTTFENLTTMLNNTPENTDQILNSFLSKFASCETVEWFRNVYLVSLCPPDFADISLKSKCENSEGNLLPPVTAVFRKGSVSFKNIYCAQCHNIDSETLQPWLVNLDCYKTAGNDNMKLLTIAQMTELVASKECNITYTVPPGTCEPRLCEPGSRLSKARRDQIAFNVNNGNCSPADAILCQTYILSNPYRNPSCDRCLNSTNLPHKSVEYINICNLTNPYVDPPPNPKPGRGGWNPTGGILIILDITGIYSNDDTKTSFYACEDNQVFDPFFLQCRTLVCSSGFEPFRGSCIDSSSAFFVPKSSQIFPNGWSRLDILTNTSETSAYISCGQILENTEAKIPHKHFVLEQVLINDYKDINGTFPQNITTSFFQCEEYITRQQSNWLQSVDVILSITEDISLDTINELDQLAESLIPLRSKDEGFQISVSNMRSFPNQAYTCTYGRVLAQRSDFSLVEYKGVAYVVFNHTEQGVFYPLGNIGYELTIAVQRKADNSLNFLYKVYICQERQLLFRKNCSVVVYFLNETQQEGNRLLITTSNEYYNEGDFYTEEDQVYVCSNFEFKIEQENGKNSVPYVVVTCVVTALSVACLLIMIVIYCIFPELRSLPGKMSSSLAATMMLTFLANLFTLADLHNDFICPVMAAVSHVITLSHFGWMAAISVNMALTFGPGIHSLVKSCDDKKAYLRYSIIVWGISLVIVLTSVIMDFTHRGSNANPNFTTPSVTDQTVSPISATNYPRYGEPYCTWFSGPLWVRLSFIVIPYFITYIISLTGFLLTLVGINQSNKNAGKVGNKTSEKTLCLIYIKLSTAMGFAWVFSIVVSVYPDCQVLPYIYVSLVLLQGVLLFLAFTANRKVYSLIMKKYFSVEQSNSKDGTQISSFMTNTL